MEKNKKAAFFNLGCKVNDFDTESMKAIFINRGYEIVNFNDAADVYVVNTCTVTHLGDRKSRQMLRRARRTNPDAVIVASGCYAQVSPKEVEAIDEVDLVFGTQNRSFMVDQVEAFAENHRKQDFVQDISKRKEFEEMPIAEQRDHTRAFIKVQDGCNQFCSYCIVPYARGQIRSRNLDSVLNEVKILVNDGYKEFVITGIHVASYGKDLGASISLIDLIEAVAHVQGVERVRLSSLEPTIVTEDFLKRVSQLPEFCPHFHLSLQSGSNTVLKRMNRHYTTEIYEEVVKNIRQYFELPAVTTDIIVGFPGETEEEFLESKAFAEKIAFYHIHVFQYSKRSGTVAATMDHQIDPSVKHQRSKELISVSDRTEQMFLKANDQLTAEVLFERKINDIWHGHTMNYIPVQIPGLEKNNFRGKIKKVTLQYFEGHHFLTGKII